MASSSSFAEMYERTQELIEAASHLVSNARALRETCRELRHDSIDLRDFLRENDLRLRCRYEQWVEGRFDHI